MRLVNSRLSLAVAAMIILGSGVSQARTTHYHSGHIKSSGRQSHEFYHSSDGSMVHGPTHDMDTTYGKPSAHCNDGTWSHSHHHQGTCSGHGGVTEWL